MPVTIFRPSVVVGDSETGETAKYDGIYYLIQYLRKFPALLRFVNVGNSQVKLNLVPVDFVVEAIAALAKDENGGRQNHRARRPESALTTAQLFDAIVEAMTGKKSVVKPPPAFGRKISDAAVFARRDGLAAFGRAVFFSDADLRHEHGSRELLSAHDVKCPNFSAYVKNLLKFVEKNPRL